MSYSGNYNVIDRALHHFAFSSPIIQKTLSDIENDLFKNALKDIRSQNEVFITGLPRAGTTLTLELLYATREFQAFQYSDMPFILSPLLWNKLSRSFRKTAKTQERAHGDGMEISVDSPEAFDEVVWLAYLAKIIVGEKTLKPIVPDDLDDDFRDAMRLSVRKILAKPQKNDSDSLPSRYLSKNNANISRIRALQDLFPTSQILVVFRHPLAHIGSLAKQHDRFLHEHGRDAFSKKYMKWIGHYEFGANFKPINFAGWLDNASIPSPVDETFWLSYWNEAYSHALDQKTDQVLFVDFDGMLQDGASSLRRIGKTLGLNHESELLEAGKTLRSPTTTPVELGQCSPNTWSRAQEIYAQLKAIAI